ncbi:hypothetical protein FJZ19_02115 [Candidatus Pacearchaeota archaeon]|nr:hypothetical protein [Candidatus Pacearchaeota archaeon]
MNLLKKLRERKQGRIEGYVNNILRENNGNIPAPEQVRGYFEANSCATSAISIICGLPIIAASIIMSIDYFNHSNHLHNLPDAPTAFIMGCPLLASIIGIPLYLMGRKEEREIIECYTQKYNQIRGR